MRVGIDYWPGVAHAPGVGRFSRELVRALVRRGDCPELALLELGPSRPRLPERLLGLDGARVAPHRVRWVAPRRALALAGRLVGVDRLVGGLDVVQRVRPGWPPVARAATCLPVSEFPLEGEDDARFRAELAAEDALLAFSDHAVAELESRYGVARDRIHRLPVGCDHWARELAAPPPRDEPPLLLALGALRTARRPLDVLEGFERLVARGRDARLALVTGGGERSAEFGSRLGFSSARSRVELVAPDEDALPALVARASVLVHLSAAEATPVTPLEAFAAGTAVVASDLPAFREALGDEAVYAPAPVRRGGGEALADALEAALASASDPAAAERRRAVAAPFTWDACAGAAIGAWSALAERRPARR